MKWFPLDSFRKCIYKSECQLQLPAPRPSCGVAGAGGNGAIIHYRAEKGSCKVVDKDTLLLLDSGGQFDCGTTDVTRTMHFGTPTDHQKMCFTRVLQVLLPLFFPSSFCSYSTATSSSSSPSSSSLLLLLGSDRSVHFGRCNLHCGNWTVQFVSLQSLHCAVRCRDQL